MTLQELRLQVCFEYDFAVEAGSYNVLAFEVRKVVVQFLALGLVLVGVGGEDFVCHGMLQFLVRHQGPRADTSAVGAIHRPLRVPNSFVHQPLRALDYSGFSTIVVWFSVLVFSLYVGG
jgi:hypothetical protein